MKPDLWLDVLFAPPIIIISQFRTVSDYITDNTSHDKSQNLHTQIIGNACQHCICIVKLDKSKKAGMATQSGDIQRRVIFIQFAHKTIQSISCYVCLLFCHPAPLQSETSWGFNINTVLTSITVQKLCPKVTSKNDVQKWHSKVLSKSETKGDVQKSQIFLLLVLISTHIERFSVSAMQDVFDQTRCTQSISLSPLTGS